VASRLNLKTIWNDKNMGFAAAVNQGIKESKGEFVLLLNPDTELRPGSLQTMFGYLRNRREVGVAGGKILNSDGSLQPSVRRFPTAWDQAVILLKMHNFFPKIVAKYFCEGLNYDVEQEVDQVRGAYFWVSRKLIEKIGVLDAKSFFIWFEEVDYCRRAWDAGFKVMYLPSSVALHAGGASFNQEPSFQKQRWLNRSMRNYFRKHGTALDVMVATLLSPVSLALSYGVGRFKIKPKKYV
jgi:GT2 family glycosyltransferase